MTQSSTPVSYTSVSSLPEIWPIAAKHFGNLKALHDPHHKPEVLFTYSELNQQIQQFATGLQTLGIQPGDHVALFADNSPRWFIADQGIMTAGAANAVRSSQAEQQELHYILTDSESTTLVVENQKTLQKLQSFLQDLPLKLIVLLSDEEPEHQDFIKILNFTQLMEAGKNASLEPVQQARETLATLIYTSGTTGKPKGVMLTHGNLLHQVITLGNLLKPEPGSSAVSILPTWHSYERAGEYFLLSQGCAQVYTSIRYVKQDLKTYKPAYMMAVPRLWESIYEGVQKQFREQPSGKQKLINFFLGVSRNYVREQRLANNLSLEHLGASEVDRFVAKLTAIALSPLHFLGDKMVYKKIREGTGGNLRAIVSGGGSLAKHLDEFFEIAGLPVLVGYGLTETSPVTNVRLPEHNVRGTAGQPITDTDIKIVDPQTRQSLPQGEKGLVLIRGPQVMQGYYGKPEATAKAIDADGWFDSGDLGWLTLANDLVLTGRAKDTIVLTNGENIEPQPIEDACIRSAYIDQMMLVGQDQRSLGALVVPNLEALTQFVQEENLKLELPQPGDFASTIDLNTLEPIQKLFRQEITREVKDRPGYRPDDRIGNFVLILEPFSIENGLTTRTLKLRRPAIGDRYQDLIQGLFQ